jgi:hypothetical protein
MKFIPYDMFYLKSNLSLKEVLERINENIFLGTDFLGFYEPTVKLYHGSVKKNQFTVKRIPKGSFERNHGVVILGKVFNSSTGTVVKVRLRLNIILMIFLIAWLTGVAFGTIRLIVRMIHEHQFHAEIFQCLLMFAIGFIIPILLLKVEGRKVKEFLQDILA